MESPSLPVTVLSPLEKVKVVSGRPLCRRVVTVIFLGCYSCGWCGGKLTVVLVNYLSVVIMCSIVAMCMGSIVNYLIVVDGLSV